MTHVARLVSAKCPHCGAPISIPPNTDHVTCQYCAHSAFIQRDPKVAPPPREAVIVVQSSGLPILPLVIAGIFTSLGVLGAVVALVQAPAENDNVLATAARSVASSVATTTTRLQFTGTPLPYDVNGDGTLDVIGLSRTPGGASWLAGYDGRDGTELWRSAALDKAQENSPAHHGLVHDVVVVVDNLGKIQAYRAKNGEPAWAALLGERAQSMCQGDGFVRITASDRSTLELDIATGQKRKSEPAPERRVAPKPDCRSVPQAGRDDGAGFHIVTWSQFGTYGLPSINSDRTMSAHRALVADDGHAFMLGSKSSGSSVAMIARVKKGKQLWKDVVPGVDPLTTTVNVTTQRAAYAAGRVVVPYDLAGSRGVRMAAFDVESGRRIWDVAVHDKSQVTNGLQLSDRDVFFSTWTSLYVLDAATGKQRFRVGTEL